MAEAKETLQLKQAAMMLADGYESYRADFQRLCTPERVLSLFTPREVSEQAAPDERAREIVKKISDAAIELAFVRHSLTTSDYEDTEYPDVEEGVEAFKELVEEVKSDVLAVLTGDEEGCLDPEDVDNDNELEWLKRRIASVLQSASTGRDAGLEEAAKVALDSVIATADRPYSTLQKAACAAAVIRSLKTTPAPKDDEK